MNEKDYKLLPEDRKLLTKDLCGRLPYGVICKVFLDTDNHILNKFDKYSNSKLETVNCQTEVCTFEHLIGYYFGQFPIDTVRPYLRPLSTMTEGEKREYEAFFNYDGVEYPEDYIDWLNKHQFDYRGLILMGLALEAPEGMYK